MKQLLAERDAGAVRRVVVAMSGGVDSSVAAAMLHEAGFEVIGVTLKLYDAPVAKKVGACCAGIDIYDAAAVAQKLGFPHYVFDYVNRFKESVIDDFVDSYLRGETPLPCVKCNQSVKFRDLLQAARELKADALVTGHYVQRVEANGEVMLRRAVDRTKDQSYFLFATTAEQLQMLRFPLGGYQKAEIRQMAEKYGLDVAQKPDSQDICFVGGGKYSDVIAKMRPGAKVPGLIRCVQTGDVLGEHPGVIHFTVGQRRGLALGNRDGSGDPLYVVKLAYDTHTVFVGPKSSLFRNVIEIKDVNWLGQRSSGGVSCAVQIRSMQEPVPAQVTLQEGGLASVRLDEPQLSVANGQVCVVYSEGRVLGGGWIYDSSYRKDFCVDSL